MGKRQEQTLSHRGHAGGGRAPEDMVAGVRRRHRAATAATAVQTAAGTRRCVGMRGAGGHYAKRNGPDSEGHTWHDSP